MRVIIHKMIDPNKHEMGCILTADAGKDTNIQEKSYIEYKLIQYAYDVLYRGEGLSIYLQNYINMPAIAVIRDINSLPQVEVDIPI